MGSTGLLTARCDPFGAESQIKLLGGLYPEDQVGRIMWHCSHRAGARYRMVCTGGEYGQRYAAGLGVGSAYRCDGGHRGVVMPLCDSHRKSIAGRQSDLCPACAYPPAARELAMLQELQQGEMYVLYQAGRLAEAARLGHSLENLRGQMNELITRGVVHKCPLRLVEVS